MLRSNPNFYKYDPSLPLAFKMARLFEMRIEDIFEPDEDGAV